MHPDVARAIQEIDAAVFNGDTFDEPEAKHELLQYIVRWKRELVGSGPVTLDDLKERLGLKRKSSLRERLGLKREP